MKKILGLITLQVFACNVIVYSQENFSTKSIKAIVNPIYSFNGLGVRYFQSAIDNGTQQSDPVPTDYNYRPAELNVENNLNIGFGIDYEFYLKNRWFIGAGIDYRTSHLKIQYINNPLSVQNGEIPRENAAYIHEYKDNRNLLGLNVFGGKQFMVSKSSERLFDVKLGLSFVFSTNKTPTYERTAYLERFQSGSQNYLVPYVITDLSDYQTEKNFESLGYQAFFYLGSEGKKPIFKNSKLYGFYGVQVDYYLSTRGITNKTATFMTQYAYFMDGANVRYKYQQVDFTRQAILNVGLKFGLMLR